MIEVLKEEIKNSSSEFCEIRLEETEANPNSNIRNRYRRSFTERNIWWGSKNPKKRRNGFFIL